MATLICCSQAALALLLLINSCHAGTIWPRPTNQTTINNRLYIDTEHFVFRVTGFDSGILQSALERYKAILLGDQEATTTVLDHLNNNSEDYVKGLKVHVASKDQSLNLQTDESYTLEVTAPYAALSANTVFGAVRGLETFAQLLSRLEDNTSDENGYLESVEQQDEEWESGKKHKRGHKKHKKHKKKKKKHHHEWEASYAVNETSIWDTPRFRHRGLLIDTARHFLPVSVILDHLDAMAGSKMNVLHWHMVDDQSFPFVSSNFPKLSEEGAFAPDLVYTPQDIQEIVGYAKARGIRIIPEFDTPGHTQSWGRGYPSLLAECDEKERVLSQGILNPAQNETYEFLWALLQELATVFPDSYIHLGGDEVPLNCWLNDDSIQKWMAEQDPPIRGMPALEEYFERRVLDLAAAAGRSYIVWQEVLDNNVQVQADTVIQVWKWWWPPAESANVEDTRQDGRDHEFAAVHVSGFSRLVHRLTDLIREVTAGVSLLKAREHVPSSMTSAMETSVSSSRRRRTNEAGCQLSKGCQPEEGAEGVPSWTLEMERVTSRGYRALLSSPWYLNLGGFASNDWAKYYAVEPLQFQASREQKELVIGGEACMWGEYVDETNAIQKTWPRAAAVAERLWSDASVRDLNEALPRLIEHRCRLWSRGIAAEPLGPGYCPGDISTVERINPDRIEKPVVT